MGEDSSRKRCPQCGATRILRRRHHRRRLSSHAHDVAYTTMFGLLAVAVVLSVVGALFAHDGAAFAGRSHDFFGIAMVALAAAAVLRLGVYLWLQLPPGFWRRRTYSCAECGHHWRR